MTTSGRLLELLSLLQTRRDWSGDELASRLEVSGRTIRRDVDRLRQLGYPVESLTGPAGGYRLRAGTAMPPLLLDDDEAIAIAVGLRTAAGSAVSGIEETSVRALVKLEQVLPKHLRPRVQALQTATTSMAPPGPQVDAGCLTVLAAGCRDHERVRFAYRGRDGAESRREVEPHALVHLRGKWYLLAWDLRREDWRTFRVDRVAEPMGIGTRFAERAIPGGDPAKYVSRNLSSAPYRYEARLTLHASADEIRERVPWLWGTLEAVDGATCLYTTGDDQLEWLAVRIGMLGVDFEVHDPPELAEHLRALAGRFARAAG